MAPRKRRSAAAATPKAPTPPAGDSGSELSDAAPSDPPSPSNTRPLSKGSLSFKETLAGRPGRPVPVATLLTRLQKLDQELQSRDQEESDEFKESCKPVAKELSDPSILAHKDKGVRAYAAQCIVDLLSVCAPDAPFSTQGLKAIFEMITKTVFPALADPGNAYNMQHIYVLESLASVKSILLMTDIPGSAKLITQVFTTFFDILAGISRQTSNDERISKHVEFHMLSAMVVLVDESEGLPQDVIDITVAQFLRADPRLAGQKDSKPKKGEKADDRQTSLIRQELPAAYVASKEICNAAPEKMAREASKYFSEVIIEASGANTDGSRRKSSGDVDDAEESLAGPSEEDLHELQKAHRLVRELWRACPAVLQSVVPQLEAELSAENVHLRVLATETLGDLVAGIGAAGPPPVPAMDPAAYPPIRLSRAAEPQNFDPMTTPTAPQAFSNAHPQAWQAFLTRRQDKSLLVRAAWTTAIGRILSTNAGGVGLSHNDEKRLLDDLARMLNDNDEKVRVAAIKSIRTFNSNDAINKLGSIGGVDQEGSILSNLASRVKDRRPLVRVEAMNIMSLLWSAAHGEIADGNEQVRNIIGGAPSHILNTFYVNSTELNELLDKVLFEVLLPVNYPPIKSKGSHKSNGSSQRAKESQDADEPEPDPDMVRANRMLLLINGLDERATKIFYSLCSRQAIFKTYVQVFLQVCEDYNGGVMGDNETQIQERLTALIEQMAKMYEERQRVSADLWKFAKMHDRRNYQLVRFCLDPKSDFRTVVKAMRELNKRVSESSHPSLLESLTPILYRASLLLYNRSNVPAILESSKSTDQHLSSISHEILKDMSQKTPEVLETHIREMCQSLQDDAPSKGRPNGPGAVNNLKACAAFAKKFPHKLPQDRKFTSAITSYTLYGSPPEAAKHAVSIIASGLASGKKEAVVHSVTQPALTNFKYGVEGFLSRLATMTQVLLVTPEESERYADEILEIALNDVLTKVRDPAPKDSGYEWTTDLDDECEAKKWAIKMIVNRIRSHRDAQTLREIADPVLATLSTIVSSEGDLSPAKDTPATHKPQLRLLAGLSFLKLCRSQRHDQLLDALAFQKLAEIAQDGLFEVRDAFMRRLKKYLGANTLPPRFYTILFLIAYEPIKKLKDETTTWLKSRALFYVNQASSASVNGKQKANSRAQTTMEAIIARLISALAHHPDYDPEPDGLAEMGQYIIYYLCCVANTNNISLIYHIAQRVKAHRDAVLDTSQSKYSASIKKIERRESGAIDYDTRLHTLSDLTCAIIRAMVEVQDWNLQSLPGRANLPKSLFHEIKGDDQHEIAIAIAEKNFLPAETAEKVEGMVREALKKKARPEGNRKRKSEAVALDSDDQDGEAKAKKARRASTGKPRSQAARRSKGSKRRNTDWGSESDGDGGRAAKSRNTESNRDRRKSGRASNAVKYEERDDDEDDEEMLGGVAEWEYENGERQREEVSDESEVDEGDDEEDGESDGEPKSNGHDQRANTEEEDVEMSGQERGTSPPAPVPKSRASARGTTSLAKGKGLKSTPTKSTPAKAGSGKGGKASKVTPKNTPRSLPTRSGGRATRSTATAH